MTSSGILASAKWRSKTLEFADPAVNKSRGGDVPPSSASSVTSEMRNPQMMPMSVKQLTAIPPGSNASVTSRMSATSLGTAFSTASAKWRSKWPSAPASAKTKAAKQPNQASEPAPAKAAPAAGAVAATSAASGAPALEQIVESQEAASSSVAAPAPADETPAAVETAPSTAPSTEVPAPAEPVAVESNESPAEAIEVAPAVAQATEDAPAMPAPKEEVAAQAEQVESAATESEQPVPAVSTTTPAEPRSSESAAAPVAPEVLAAEAEAPPATTTASVAAVPAPPLDTPEEGTREAAEPVLQESAPAPAPAAAAASSAAVSGKAGGLKVALLDFGGVAAPLGDKDEIEQVFKWRKLEPLWVDKADNFPQDAVVLITSGTPVGPEILAKAPELKLVAVASDGYDFVDIDACKARGIAVVNVPGCSTDAAAELAMGFVLAHLRNVATSQKTLDDGFWTCPSQDKLSSKTVGLVGVGSLGLRLAELFNAFSVNALLGYSPAQSAAFTELGGTYVDSLEDLFRRSDVVCVCCSLCPETHGLVSEALLELLRPTSVLVNVAHGGIIDEDALGRFLANGRFRAGLDVFRTEPLPADSSLRNVPATTLLATPHVGYQTMECLENRLDHTIKNIIAFQLDQAINRVDI